MMSPPMPPAHFLLSTPDIADDLRGDVLRLLARRSAEDPVLLLAFVLTRAFVLTTREAFVGGLAPS